MGSRWSIREISALTAVPELQLVDVFYSPVKKKQASELIGLLNYYHPLPSLRHLRRARSIADGRGPYVEVLLCLAPIRPDGESPSLPVDIADIVQRFELKPVITKVPSLPAPTLALWSEWSHYWAMPWRMTEGTTYPPDMTKEIEERADDFLTRVVELAQVASGDNAALIVDPASNRMIAAGLNHSTAKLPLRHAVMEAIAAVAQRDLSTWPEATEPPEKRARTTEPSSNVERPYLCTGYEIYCLKEPCLMCAMAMVHSRFLRAIYCEPDVHDGAFTVHGLHGKKGLNHHYTVYHATDDHKEDKETSPSL